MNAFEEQVINAPGNAQEKMRRIYGKELTYSNAKKYLAGIKLHIDTLSKLEQN